MGVVYFVTSWHSASETLGTAKHPRVHSIIGEFSPGPIKIGYTDQLYRRLLTISSATRQRVWLAGAFIGGPSDERRMHDMFAHLRLVTPPFPRATTEWFRPEWELQTFIAALPVPPITDIDFTMKSIKRRGRPADPLQVLPPTGT